MQMPTDQHVEMLWETPSESEIIGITKQHVMGLEHSDADEVWQVAGMHHILIHTVGRKSGNVHKIALPTWNDPGGHRIVVGSFAGAVKHPAWVLNLRDREESLVRCQVQAGSFWSDVELLEGDDYESAWQGLTDDRAWYNDYQAKTDRQIHLIRLPETQKIVD
jgi:deazaflavin-dependent oxidoreductase (nitroreductase family)